MGGHQEKEEKKRTETSREWQTTLGGEKAYPSQVNKERYRGLNKG